MEPRGPKRGVMGVTIALVAMSVSVFVQAAAHAPIAADATVVRALEEAIKHGDLAKLKGLITQAPSGVNTTVSNGQSLIERVADYTVWHRP